LFLLRDELELGEAHFVAMAVRSRQVRVNVGVFVPAHTCLVSLTVEKILVEASREEVRGKGVGREANFGQRNSGGGGTLQAVHTV